MRSCLSLAVSFFLATAASADTFTATIVLPGGNQATPGQPLPIEIRGTLTTNDPGNDGLSLFSIDLSMTGPQTVNLGQALLIAAPGDGSMDNFVKPLGLDTGYGGSPVGDVLKQTGGAQNTVGNNPALPPEIPYPAAEFITFDVAHTETVLLQGSLTMPMGVDGGTYTLQMDTVLANVLTDGQTPQSFGVYTVEDAGGIAGNSVEIIVGLAGDVDGNGVVNFQDIVLLLSAWGPVDHCPPTIPADINEDCVVDFADLLIVLANWS